MIVYPLCCLRHWKRGAARKHSHWHTHALHSAGTYTPKELTASTLELGSSAAHSCSHTTLFGAHLQHAHGATHSRGHARALRLMDALHNTPTPLQVPLRDSHTSTFYTPTQCHPHYNAATATHPSPIPLASHVLLTALASESLCLFICVYLSLACFAAVTQRNAHGRGEQSHHSQWTQFLRVGL